MNNLTNFTKEELDFICEHYQLIPKYKHDRKEKGIVYIMYKDDEVLYVGRTKDIKNRINHHFKYQLEDWKLEVNKLVYFTAEMYEQEIYYIHTLNPKYNKDRFENVETPAKTLEYDRKEVIINNGVITEKDFSKKIKIDDILETIKYLSTKPEKEINLTKEIRAKHYSVNTPSCTIGTWFRGKNRKDIEELCNSFNIELESRRGRFGGMWLIFK